MLKYVKNKEESKDGFVDLYNYWNEIYTHKRSGKRRFYSKIAANKERINGRNDNRTK